MPKTNKERLQDNNIELQNIKTGIDNLPEYQDIEPIYANENFSTLKTNLSYKNNIYIVSNLDNKYISYYVSNGNPYYHYIARVNNDGTLTNLFYKQYGSGGNSWSIELIDYDDDYLYVYNRYKYANQRVYSWKFQRFDLSTNTLEDNIYWDCPVEQSGWLYGESCFNYLGNKYAQVPSYSYPIYKLDMKNKIAQKVKSPKNQTTYSLVLNPDIIAANVTGTYTYIVLLNLLTGAELKVNVNAKTYNAILVSNDKVVINNNLYILNENLTTGDLIKENVIENYVANATWLMNIYPSYYMEYNRGILYYFNEDTNMFEKVLNTSGIIAQNSYNYKSYNANICNINGAYNIIKADNSSNIIGYKYNGTTMMLPNGLSVSSDKLLTGSYLYNKFNVGVAGTMPNNGVLNYTPTTSQQTIPTGYTSGGTIGAIDYSGQGALSPQDTATAEAQIEDLFGEGE